MNKIDPDYIEKCIIKTSMIDKNFGITISDKFIPEFFDSDAAGIIFSNYRNYIQEFKSLPQEEIITNSVDEKNKEKVQNYFLELSSMELDVAKSYDWVFENTNEYLKEKALKHAILKSIDVIEAKESTDKVKEYVEEALCKDMKVDLGLNYFSMLSDRLKRMFYAVDNKVKTYYPSLDELTNGGLNPYTLSVILAATGVGKSLLMANILARQVLAGHTGILYTCEMSEDAFAQRFDSIYSKLDINRMYIQKKLQNNLVKSLKKIKEKENRGELYIKEFPTGKASVSDIRTHLKELQLRGIKPSIIFVDYITLMLPSDKAGKTTNSNEKVKDITRGLRALSMEFEAPVVSAGQINREGSKLDLKEVDMNFISDGIAIAQDSDFCIIIGDDPDATVYESTLFYKVTKNRLGGRVGVINKIYLDSRSLRLYDGDLEYESWIKDAKESGDERNMAEKD